MIHRTMLFLLAVVLPWGSGVCVAAEATRIDPKDLVYQGAFRLPADGPEEYDWKWSGEALAYRPDGNPQAAEDDLPGSLIGSGHNWHQWVSEITIPKPAVSAGKNLDDLPVAKMLQKFTNITGELYAGREIEQPRMGLAYLPPTAGQAAGAVYFCRAAHLGEEDRLATLGVCTPNFADPQPRGLWNFGGLRNYYTDDYLLTIPADWAAKNTPGKLLACGRFRDGGQASQGPALFAFAPIDPQKIPKAGEQIAVTPLLKYSSVIDENNTRTIKDYRHSDTWSGAAWMEHGEKSAMLFVGTKGLGKTWYGYANGVVWPEQEPYPPVPDAPNDQRGWWSEQFQPTILFYDPADLAKVAAGTLAPHEPQPYATLNIDDVMFVPAAKRTRQMIYLGAAACDRANGLLYVMEILVDDDRPIVHVWKVREKK